MSRELLRENRVLDLTRRCYASQAASFLIHGFRSSDDHYAEGENYTGRGNCSCRSGCSGQRNLPARTRRAVNAEPKRKTAGNSCELPAVVFDWCQDPMRKLDPQVLERRNRLSAVNRHQRLEDLWIDVLRHKSHRTIHQEDLNTTNEWSTNSIRTVDVRLPGQRADC